MQADAVLVDEAAMLDISLGAALLDALPPHCQLLLVGKISSHAQADLPCAFCWPVSARYAVHCHHPNVHDAKGPGRNSGSFECKLNMIG